MYDATDPYLFKPVIPEGNSDVVTTRRKE